jgi:hypothetical protein
VLNAERLTHQGIFDEALHCQHLDLVQKRRATAAAG